MRAGHYKRANPVYESSKWKTVRRQVLERDGGECMIGLVGCTGKAEVVDHITPLAFGGEPYDSHNLRAACKNCNGALAKLAQKHGREKKRQLKAEPTPGNGQPSRTW
jgi:5-methylcytosine-specific restriction endonuclease McrA